MGRALILAWKDKREGYTQDRLVTQSFLEMALLSVCVYTHLGKE